MNLISCIKQNNTDIYKILIENNINWESLPEYLNCEDIYDELKFIALRFPIYHKDIELFKFVMDDINIYYDDYLNKNIYDTKKLIELCVQNENIDILQYILENVEYNVSLGNDLLDYIIPLCDTRIVIQTKK